MAAAAATLIGAGLLTMAGWVFEIDALVQLRSGQGVMCFNAALSFALLGFGLLGSQSLDPRLKTAAMYGLFVALALALANAAQIATGLDLHINLSAMHARLHTASRIPGQMAEATTAALAMASIAALTLRCPQGSTSAEVGRTLSALVTIIGLLALIGHLAGIEWLYSWQAFGRMSLPTSLCTSITGIALWQSRGARTQTLSDERQITAVSSAALIGMAAVAALICAVILRSENKALLSRSVELDRSSTGRGIESLLAVAADRAALLASRAELKQALSDPAALGTLLNDPVLSTSSVGLSRLSLHGPSQQLLAQAGPADLDGMIEIPLTLSAPGRHALRWNGGFEMRSRILLPAGDGSEMTLLVMQPLQGLHAAVAPVDGGDNIKLVRLCGRAVDGDSYCLERGASASEDRLVTPTSLMLELLKPAYRGETRTDDRLTADASEGSSLAVAGPIGSSGLVLLIEADPEAVVVPAGHRVVYGLLLIAGVAILAVLVLRARIKPLVVRMIASETRYQAVVKALHEGLVLQRADGTIVASNPAARRILGLSEDQLHGLTSVDPRWRSVHPDGREWAGEDHPAMRTLRSGQPEVDVEMGIQHADGSLRWLRVNTEIIDEPGSEHDRSVVVSFEDVTDQRNTEMLSRQLEQRYRLLIDNIPDHAVFMLGPEGTVVSWSKGAEQVTGYRAEEVQGRHFSVFYTAEDRLAKRPERELTLARESGRYNEEGWRVRKDGSRYWVSALVSAIRDPAGHLIGYAKVTRDLTERHRYEQQVADANRLRDEMLRSAPYATIAFGLDGIITAFNPAAERMLWYRAEDVIGRASAELVHDARELGERADEMSAELGVPICPGIEVLTYRPRLGITEEQEWLFVRKDGSRFPVNLAISAMRDGEEQVTGFFGVAYDITERKRREEYTRHVAHHDFLTGLPNRLLLNDRLEMSLQRARRSGEQVAVLMLDLDHFKRVNDSLGHHVGDELLKVAAERITGCVRTIDTVARMGGDEFVIVLGQLDDPRDAELVAAKIVDAVGMPVQIGMHELTVTPSLGISIFPDDGDAPGMLLKHADSAMYRMKAAGRRGYRTFNSEMARLSQERLDTESAIRQALRHDEFRVHYQPQIALDSGEVCGMEALLRWQDPVKGPVLPERFIDVAEESGLIGPVGEWVLRTACRDACELQRKTGQRLRLAVNLSPRQFRQEELLGVIASALGDSGLPPDCLELEITEGVLMADTEETIERLHAIRALGVSIAIDDFGVGFSSLSYITRFRIDTLKIDRSFVSKLPGSANDAAVAQAIIALGRSLNITVVAEGVETAEQLEFLRERRCDAAQGALIGAAAPAASLNIQGYCFGEAVSAETFAAGFDALKVRSLRSVPRAA